MKIDIQLAKADEKPVLRRMLELYAYDFSEFDTDDLNDHGEFGYDYLDCYWVLPDRHPFIVRVEGKLAGFVFVNRVGWVEASEHSLAEFLILRKYRGKGIGRHVALNVLERFPGTWEVKTQRNNERAIRFWRDVLDDATISDVTEFPDGIGDWDGLLWTFTNKKKKTPDEALNRTS